MSPATLEYPFERYPDAGTTIEVAPGIHWISTPLPFRLRAINLYLLEDDDGWTIVDCGYSRQDVREQWEQVWATTLGGKPVTRFIITHFHPDHTGNSAWLSERWNIRPWMTQAEWLSAQLAWQGQNNNHIECRCGFYAANGLDKIQQEVFRTGVVPYARGVQLPRTYHRLVDGDELVIKGKAWKVIVGEGHSPEHASLYCEELGVLLAGDQLLPEITTNISVWPSEPEADPLSLFIASLDRFKQVLRPDTLVLPSHRKPFRGGHQRIDELKHHHHERLNLLLSHARKGTITAGGLLPILFLPGLDGHQIGFAMGEALAHLNYLVNKGMLGRHEDQGVTHFSHHFADESGFQEETTVL